MSGLLGMAVLLGLVWVAFSVLGGKTKPGDAFGRIGLVALLLLLAPLLLSMLNTLVITPLVAAFWTSAVVIFKAIATFAALLVLGGLAALLFRVILRHQ